MTIDQVIAAQEANEADAMNARITFAQFKAREAQLERARSAAMVAIVRRIASTARAADCWAWALDEARWQFRDVYRITDRTPFISHV